jgi:hypothetical protein
METVGEDASATNAVAKTHDARQNSLKLGHMGSEGLYAHEYATCI